MFTTIQTQGALLPVDLLRRVAERDRELSGLSEADYHLSAGERFNEVIARGWNRLLGAWKAFQGQLERLPGDDLATTVTRERWLLPLFETLGYGRLQTSRARQAGGKEYPISHSWNNLPIHLIGARVDLGQRAAGVAGAARVSPHSLLQELLNQSSDHLWGIVSNGLSLRLLRDNARLARQDYVEFDLKGMMEGEVYSDFVLLWLLCHQSRLEGERPEHCWLERWTRETSERGVRALDGLRASVEVAIAALGRGFLAYPSQANDTLRLRLRSGELDKQEYYRQLLRTVYRLIFLFVSEDRDLLLMPEASDLARDRYTRYYSTARLRLLAEQRRGTRHPDLWRGLSLVCRQLGSDEGCPQLALPALGGYLWSDAAVADLIDCDIANVDLLNAVRNLSFVESGGGRWPVDYRNLGSEELGSVYESLLELHPELNVDARTFGLSSAGGNERKTTGSYYTPASLISELLDSALEPVIDAALAAATPRTRESQARAILNLRVVDPAAGSGHFLVAAAHRMAKRLAAVRTGDDEPAPEAVRAALREVIGRCIYGVDINPMAVELCKVSLWLEAMAPGRPLSFLDHHIQCGNSLLGATPALLAGGIPDAAFTPIEGDDKTLVADWKRRNREQRAGQMSLAEPSQPWERLGDFAAAMQLLDEEPDDSAAAVRAKQELWEQTTRSSGYAFTRLWADAWCAAFVWRKSGAANFAYPITENVFRDIERTPYSIPGWMRDEIRRLAGQYQFFHWQIAFPDVFRVPGPNEKPDNERAGWLGGFDCVLGNPPWEQMQLDAREFFAERNPAIINAPHMAARNKMIEQLKQTNPSLHAAFMEQVRANEGTQHFVHNSGRYPLTSYGRLNTAPLFAELARSVSGADGRVGVIVPTGIATDSFNQYFFNDLTDTNTLVSLYDFENREKIFPAVDSRQKFCLLTMAGAARPAAAPAEFVFFAHQVDDLREPERRFSLSAAEIALLNPNTRTCPIFRSRRDAEITKAIYRRVPVLVNELDKENGNPWGFRGLLMFMMNTASHLFRTREQLEGDGWRLRGNTFVRHEPATHPSGPPLPALGEGAGGEGPPRYLPLYEAKMIHQFDHRWATYDGLETRDLTGCEKADPGAPALPRYWVPDAEVDGRLRGRWDRGWLLGWRDITNSPNERTVIASVLPRVGVGNKVPLMLLEGTNITLAPALISNLASICYDYAARQKVGGTTLNFFIYRQLPVQPPPTFSSRCPWQTDRALFAWLLPRVLELIYTAWDLEAFAKDCGYGGPPFRWDDERRFLLRCELDAAYFHLYGIARDDVDYIMETFPIVKRRDMAAHGEYRTKRVILEIYDAMAEATRTGEPYQTRLDPPPADPWVAHAPRALSSSRVGGAE
ncbi:MAG: N-6 DNA methylase [Hyphomicrobiales bacterium]|nr:N-6 DNA methylase [Hyphomicrobiales bacterium]